MVEVSATDILAVTDMQYLQYDYGGMRNYCQYLLYLTWCPFARWSYSYNTVISSQVLFHDGSLLLSKVQYTTVDYN
jgi:hypothetical protein